MYAIVDMGNSLVEKDQKYFVHQLDVNQGLRLLLTMFFYLMIMAKLQSEFLQLTEYKAAKIEQHFLEKSNCFQKERRKGIL